MALWAAVIVGREIAVSALREWMAELGQRARVKVAYLGKVKTAVQMIAICCLLYAISPGRPVSPGAWQAGFVFHVGDWLLAVAALLTLWSGFEYLRAAWPILRAGEGAAVDTPHPPGKMPPLTRE
jgi:CDP-diacylglycerol--glycerol-3-phosphate 3-phosphatidyltransferase